MGRDRGNIRDAWPQELLETRVQAVPKSFVSTLRQVQVLECILHCMQASEQHTHIRLPHLANQRQNTVLHCAYRCAQAPCIHAHDRLARATEASQGSPTALH